MSLISDTYNQKRIRDVLVIVHAFDTNLMTVNMHGMNICYSELFPYIGINNKSMILNDGVVVGR